MKYKAIYTDSITKNISKTKRKSPLLYGIVRRKIDEIIQEPNKRYKFLRGKQKGYNRIHLGAFVLIFRIDHQEKTIFFDHHDTIYDN